MILISETPTGPSHDGHFDVPEGRDNIIAYATGIWNGTVLTDPNPFVDTAAQMLCKVSINVAADLPFAAIRVDDKFGFGSFNGGSSPE
jgi:hypothetical protein